MRTHKSRNDLQHVDAHSDAYPAIRLDGVSKRFGDTLVIAETSLEIAQGQKVAIIGPSGSGKTTLLRLLIGLEVPNAGTVEIEGDPLWRRDIGGKPTAQDQRRARRVRRKIGMVFQQFNLFPHMTALENITEAPRRVLGLDEREADRKGHELLRMVGLIEKAEARPHELSGGQQQRVAIARALALEPAIMLFDEVTSALDPELVGEVLAVIRKLAYEQAMTLVIVTHEMSFAADIADQVIFMDHGRIVEDSSPDVIFRSPSNDRTRAFLRRVTHPEKIAPPELTD